MSAISRLIVVQEEEATDIQLERDVYKTGRSSKMVFTVEKVERKKPINKHVTEFKSILKSLVSSWKQSPISQHKNERNSNKQKSRDFENCEHGIKVV